MEKEILQEYPALVDSFLDFEATREHFGTGSCNYAISEKKLNDGQIVVYLHQQRESDKWIYTSTCYDRICEHGIIICGYKINPKGIFSFLKSSKIKPLSDLERDVVNSELLKKLEKKPDYVNFW